MSLNKTEKKKANTFISIKSDLIKKKGKHSNTMQHKKVHFLRRWPIHKSALLNTAREVIVSAVCVSKDHDFVISFITLNTQNPYLLKMLRSNTPSLKGEA